MNENPAPPEHPQPPRRLQVAVSFTKPYATYALIGITTFFFLLQMLGDYGLGGDVVAYLGEKINSLIRAGQIWRLITPLFLHGSVLHIGFNMYALFLYGRSIEARFGRSRFLLLYFLSGFAGNVLSFLLTPNPSLGASTAIFGLLAAEGVFLIQNRQLLGPQAGRAFLNLLMIAAINLVFGFTTTGVDNYGHLGGILGGIIFTWFEGPRWKVEGAYPALRLIDEREGRGSLAGTIAVLLFFIPLAALGWVWIIK